MRFAKMMTAVAACSLAVSPALAAPASKLSLSSARATTATGESNEAAGGFLIPAIAIIAVILGVVVAVDGDDKPDSQ